MRLASSKRPKILLNCPKGSQGIHKGSQRTHKYLTNEERMVPNDRQMVQNNSQIVTEKECFKLTELNLIIKRLNFTGQK